MRILLAAALIACTTVPSYAQYYGNQRSGNQSFNYGTGSNPNSHYVQPHTRSDGGYVGGHYRTNPNNSRTDNFGASGNYNPNSGSNTQRRNAW